MTTAGIEKNPTPSQKRRGGQGAGLFFIVALLLAFVIAHGCHRADEDHEPSTRVEISSEAK